METAAAPTTRHPVPWSAVRVDDPFWSPRLRTLVARTLPSQYDQLHDSGRLASLGIWNGPGDPPPSHRFHTSDISKWLEAVAYALYDSYQLIKQAGLKINYPIVLNEGGAVSKLWRQIITDVFNVPTVLVKRRIGAPFGDAILAGVATGVFKDFSVAKEWLEYIDELTPNVENHERYMEYFNLYKQIYEHIKGDFQALARLRDGV